MSKLHMTDVVVSRLSDLTMARNAYSQAAARWPDKLVMLCHGGRIMKRSDRPG